MAQAPLSDWNPGNIAGADIFSPGGTKSSDCMGSKVRVPADQLDLFVERHLLEDGNCSLFNTPTGNAVCALAARKDDNFKHDEIDCFAIAQRLQVPS